VAVPVYRSADSDTIASVGVSVPARRFAAEKNVLIRVLRDISAEASAELTSAGDAVPPALLPTEGNEGSN
jgi:DNA-binding IclR family transcriptional regulator